MAISAELRFALFGPLWIAGFFDAGDLFESGGFAFSTTTQLPSGGTVTRTLAKGAGVGLRITTPIGPLAVDFAVPVDKREIGAGDWALHFALGTF